MEASEQVPTERPKSRRRLLRTGLGVAVAAVGAAALLEMNAGAAHADGNEKPTIFTSNASEHISAWHSRLSEQLFQREFFQAPSQE